MWIQTEEDEGDQNIQFTKKPMATRSLHFKSKTMNHSRKLSMDKNMNGISKHIKNPRNYYLDENNLCNVKSKYYKASRISKLKIVMVYLFI